ncbi:hypothetical protein H0H87_010252 [Tephrocybe sp. NHM501043]|nr:hypothetical protein H0H87_010252 [Tephrocybe sp. NHM501043]
MNTVALANLAQFGPPGLSAAVYILTNTYTMIDNVKVYRQQCSDISGRCVSLMLSLRDNSAGLEGTKAMELSDEITTIVRRIDRKVSEWAALSRLKSFLQQGEIKDGIDKLHRDMDVAMLNFNINLGLELTRGQEESKAIRERDTAEIRDVLEKIIEDTMDMKALLQSSHSVEDVMVCLQTVRSWGWACGLSTRHCPWTGVARARSSTESRAGVSTRALASPQENIKASPSH